MNRLTYVFLLSFKICVPSCLYNKNSEKKYELKHRKTFKNSDRFFKYKNLGFSPAMFCDPRSVQC